LEALLNSHPGSKGWFDYAQVGKDEAEKIQKATGLRVYNYFHTITRDEINHILNEHYDDPDPITVDDIKKYRFYYNQRNL